MPSPENRGREYPMIVLVIAIGLAAEIVVGRAQITIELLILVETTFGMVLVQTVYPMVETRSVADWGTFFYIPPTPRIPRELQPTRVLFVTSYPRD